MRLRAPRDLASALRCICRFALEQGAVCPVFLTIGDVPTPPGEAWFFGSDALRSPLDNYREPGSPPYDGGKSVESGAGMTWVKHSK